MASAWIERGIPQHLDPDQALSEIFLGIQRNTSNKNPYAIWIDDRYTCRCHSIVGYIYIYIYIYIYMCIIIYPIESHVWLQLIQVWTAARRHVFFYLRCLPVKKAVPNLISKAQPQAVTMVGSMEWMSEGKALQKRIALLVGGWATPLKNMNVNWDNDIPNINGKMKHVPNHQPVCIPKHQRWGHLDILDSQFKTYNLVKQWTNWARPGGYNEFSFFHGLIKQQTSQRGSLTL